MKRNIMKRGRENFFFLTAQGGLSLEEQGELAKDAQTTDSYAYIQLQLQLPAQKKIILKP